MTDSNPRDAQAPHEPNPQNESPQGGAQSDVRTEISGAMPNRIVRAAPRDLAALVALETACFAEAWSEKSLAILLENPAYLTLLERDEAENVHGYLIGWQVGGDVELARLGVFDSARGQGIGAKLVRAALKIWQTAGAGSVWLEVRQSNAPARRLYEAQGFRPVGKRSNYYADGETALVLQLKIGN